MEVKTAVACLVVVTVITSFCADFRASSHPMRVVEEPGFPDGSSSESWLTF